MFSAKPMDFWATLCVYIHSFLQPHCACLMTGDGAHEYHHTEHILRLCIPLCGLHDQLISGFRGCNILKHKTFIFKTPTTYHYLCLRTQYYLLDLALVSIMVVFLPHLCAVLVLHNSLWFITPLFWSMVTVALLDFVVLYILFLCYIIVLENCFVFSSSAGVFLARMTKIYLWSFI